MRNPVGNVPWRARGAARAMGTTVAAWPDLPEAIKAGIVAMVKASCEKVAHRGCQTWKADRISLAALSRSPNSVAPVVVGR